MKEYFQVRLFLCYQEQVILMKDKKNKLVL